MMKLGVCATAENAALIKQKGFDYIEIPVCSYAQVPESDFKRQLSSLRNADFTCLGANFFFPSIMKVVGPDVDSKKIEDYCKKAVDRSFEMGVKVLTIGSGKSRFCPDGFSRTSAVDQFGSWLSYVGDLIDSSDCIIGIEPIRHQSTNILNTIHECIDLAKAVNHKKVKVMTDFQQLMCQGDSFEDLASSNGMIVHAHISNSRTLACPSSSEEDEYEGFFKALLTCKYHGRLSVETLKYDDSLDPTYLREMIGFYFKES